jgi:hypothetical protein
MIMSNMIEFLIKRTDGDWFDFPPESDPYRPLSIPLQRVEGWRDELIEIDGCQISFSYEDPGIQVSFEGQIEEKRAVSIAEEIRLQIEKVSGQYAETIQISA